MKRTPLFKGRRKKAKFRINVVDHKSARMKIRRTTFNLGTSREQAKSDDDGDDQGGIDILDPQDMEANWCNSTGGDSEMKNNGDYKSRCLKRGEAWAKVRSSIVHNIVTSQAHLWNNELVCIRCKNEPACVQCDDCGGNGIYCVPCAEKAHSDINITHTPLIWKAAESRFVPLQVLRSLRFPHECRSEGYFRDLICSDIIGLKTVRIYFCNCFEEMEILTFLQLFPATPQNPQLVFTFRLLDWLEALFLECQVAIQDMVTALHMIYQQTKSSITCALYPVIIDCFEEYRYYKHELRSLKFIVKDRDNNGTRCPACFMSKTPTLAIDANFGLCRKVAAGESCHDPLHLSTGLLCKQQSVDHYVSTYSNKSVDGNKEDPECNQFLASNALRSSTRYKSLDETGLVGVVCKHEFPVLFYSLKHGERISYIVYALEELKKRNIKWISYKFLYDVSCSLVRHLQKRQRIDILSCFKFAVPVFHSYGHKVDCQLKYNPRNLKGFGMADGECCERLWSYLRRFSRITKECKPSHRIDMLTDALLYYGRMSADQLETLLPSRFRRFNHVLFESKKELEKLMKSSPVTFNVSDIKQWYNTEVHAETQSTMTTNTTTWEEEYFQLLKSYHSLKDQVTQTSSIQTVTTVSTHILQMDKKLSEIEHVHGLVSRPTPDSKEFKELKYRASIDYLDRLKIKIAILARERWFLLVLKAKFADGQYVSSRLSKSINNASAKLKKLLTEYNSYNIYSLAWEDVTDLSSHVWYEGILRGNDKDIPNSVKLKAIEKYHIMIRCEEEISYLREDMIQTVAFYINDLFILSQKILELQNESNPLTQYQKGCMILLNNSCFELEARLISLYDSFSKIVHIKLPCNIFRYHSFSSQQTVSSNELEISQITTSSSQIHHQPVITPMLPNYNSVYLSQPSPAELVTSSVHSDRGTGASFNHAAHDTHIEEPSPPSTSQIHSNVSENDELHEMLKNWKNDLHEESSSESEDEDIQQMNWRKQRLERNEYLQEMNNSLDLMSTSDHYVEYKDLLSDLKSRPLLTVESCSRSFLKINATLLRRAVQSSSRDLAKDKITGPHFLSS